MDGLKVTLHEPLAYKAQKSKQTKKRGRRAQPTFLLQLSFGEW